MNNRLANSIEAFLFGISFVLNWRSLVFLFLMTLSVILFVYFGIYVLLGLSLHNPLSGYSYHPASTTLVISAISLFILSVLFFVYFAELAILSRKLGSAKLKDLFSLSLSLYPNFLVSLCFQLIITLFGFILFIVPGFYLGVKTIFCSMLSLSDNDNPFSAILRSNALTNGDFWTPFLLILLFLLVFIAVLSTIYSFFKTNTLISFILTSFFLGYFMVSFLSSTDFLMSLEKLEKQKSHTINLSKE